MAAQTTYNFGTSYGVAGGLYDLSNKDIVTRNNDESGNDLKFGMGVVRGTTAGKGIKLPGSTSTAAVFEGVVVNSHSQEMDRSGNVTIAPKQAVGVLTYGKIWARIVDSITPAYGETLYLIISGNDAGCFTNTSGATAIEVKGRFIGTKGTGNVAPVELFYQLNEAAV